MNICSMCLYTENKISGNEDKLKNIERNQSNILPGELCGLDPPLPEENCVSYIHIFSSEVRT